MANATIASKYGTAPRATWTGVEKIPLDVSGADGVGLASTLKSYVNAADRVVLATNTTYNVATTGNDTTGDGSAGLPWATPQKAWNWITQNVDSRGFTVTIQCANGTYSGASATPVLFMKHRGLLGGGEIFFKGNAASRTSVIWNLPSGNESVVSSEGSLFPSKVTLQDLTLNLPSSAAYSIVEHTANGLLVCTNVDIGGSGPTGCHFLALGPASMLFIFGTYTITATVSTDAHLKAQDGAFIEYAPASVTGTGTIPFVTGFVNAILNSQVDFVPTAITGTFTGPKYYIQSSTLNLFDQFESVVPGTQANSSIENGSIVRGYLANSIGAFPLPQPPINTDLSPDSFSLFKDTGANTPYLAFNDGGTLKNLIGPKLFADRNYYVRTDGVDTNTGLANTAGGAFRTITHGLAVIKTIDANGFSITLNVADGNYTAESYLLGFAGFNNINASRDWDIQLLGNNTTPTNVVITGFVVTGSSEARWRIAGFSCSGFDFCALEADRAILRIGNMNINFTNTFTYGIFSDYDGNITTENAATITLSKTGTPIDLVFAFMTQRAKLFLDRTTINTTVAMPFINFFWLFNECKVQTNTVVWTNKANATGPRYNLRHDCSIWMGPETQDVTTLPGSTAGACDESSMVEGVGGALSKAGLPAATDIPVGTFSVIKDTSGGTVNLCYNDGGTIKKVALT